MSSATATLHPRSAPAIAPMRAGSAYSTTPLRAFLSPRVADRISSGVWFAGRAAVAGFFGRLPLRTGRRWRLLPVGANGQVAFAHYMSDATTGRFTAHSINVLTLQGERFSSMTAFMEPELFDRFGLAAELTD